MNQLNERNDYLAPDDNENPVTYRDQTSDDAKDPKAALSGPEDERLIEDDEELEHTDEQTKSMEEWELKHAPEDGAANWAKQRQEAVDAVMDRLDDEDLGLYLFEGSGLIERTKDLRSEDVDKIVAAYDAAAQETDAKTAHDAAVGLAQLVFGANEQSITLANAQARYGYSDRVIHALEECDVTHLDIVIAADGGEYANFTLSDDNNTPEKLSRLREQLNFDPMTLAAHQERMGYLIDQWAEVLSNDAGRSPESRNRLLKDIISDGAKILEDARHNYWSGLKDEDAEDNSDARVSKTTEVYRSASNYPDRHTETAIDAYIHGYNKAQDEALAEIHDDHVAAAALGLKIFNADVKRLINHANLAGKTQQEYRAILNDYSSQSDALTTAIEEGNGYICADVALPDLPGSAKNLNPAEFTAAVEEAIDAIAEASDDTAIDEDERKLLRAIETLVSANLAAFNATRGPLAQYPDGPEVQETRTTLDHQAEAILHFLQPKEAGFTRFLRDGIATAGRVTGQVAVNAAGNIAAGAVVAAI